jgi:hypothetical protein
MAGMTGMEDTTGRQENGAIHITSTQQRTHLLALKTKSLNVLTQMAPPLPGVDPAHRA